MGGQGPGAEGGRSDGRHLCCTGTLRSILLVLLLLPPLLLVALRLGSVRCKHAAGPSPAPVLPPHMHGQLVRQPTLALIPVLAACTQHAYIHIHIHAHVHVHAAPRI